MSISLNTSPDMKRLNPGYVENLGCSLSGGTFTICSASGSALSARNAAYVTMPSSTTPGIMKTYRVTANQTFQDNNGTSTIAGATGGVTMQAGISYNKDMPWFIYAVSNSAETAISFMISRYPNTKTSPVAAKIGQSGSASNCSTQGSFFALGSITAADYASRPCMCIGLIRMRSTSSGAGTTPGDWTVQTLTTTDGIGQFGETSLWEIPASCFGSATSTYFYANGGTAPQFTSFGNNYLLTRENIIKTTIAGSGTTVNGVGAVTLFFAMAFIQDGQANGQAFFSKGTQTFICVTYGDRLSGTTNKMSFVNDAAVAFQTVFNQDVGAANYTDVSGYYTANIVFS